MRPRGPPSALPVGLAGSRGGGCLTSPGGGASHLVAVSVPSRCGKAALHLAGKSRGAWHPVGRDQRLGIRQEKPSLKGSSNAAFASEGISEIWKPRRKSPALFFCLTKQYLTSKVCVWGGEEAS